MQSAGHRVISQIAAPEQCANARGKQQAKHALKARLLQHAMQCKSNDLLSNELKHMRWSEHIHDLAALVQLGVS